MQSKLPGVGTTIFTTMSKMAMDHQAINLAQGFPNFPVDEKLLAILEKNTRANVHQYAPMAGNPALVEQIAKLTHKAYGRMAGSEEILVTAGATQAIFTAIQALVFPGDEVIIIDPAYDCYAPAVELTGGKCVHIAMEAGFTVDWNKVEAAVGPKTKLLIINNPHNPSGKVFTANDIESLKQIMLKNESLYLLSDEVYEYISFEQKHISINTVPELLERSILISSFGKTFHITGWKIGYIVAPKAIMAELKKVHQFLVFCVNSVAQQSLAEYLTQVDVFQLGDFYKNKRDYFRTLIRDSRFNILPSEGSYFQAVDFSGISSQNDVEFCENMVKEFGVAAIPMSVFYADKLDRKVIRFCFAKDDQTLENAAEKLCRI
ncbi:MAG: 2-keto-4-methylthiobutyrate aminotransferase apoenzyme [Crocinitomicaceae bacterium]|jgi:methionine aminotransferase|nr:2-keto-4-methylthiobutyrate aminotransferase apoenzyme [Crocinitomicaceae bacterium]